jgi:hypothetical protein
LRLGDIAPQHAHAEEREQRDAEDEWFASHSTLLMSNDAASATVLESAEIRLLLAIMPPLSASFF